MGEVDVRGGGKEGGGSLREGGGHRVHILSCIILCKCVSACVCRAVLDIEHEGILESEMGSYIVTYGASVLPCKVFLPVLSSCSKGE